VEADVRRKGKCAGFGRSTGDCGGGVARESFSRTRGSVYNAAAGRFLGAAPSTLPCLPPTMPRRAGAPARLATATPTYLLFSDVAKASGGTRVLGARGQKH